MALNPTALAAAIKTPLKAAHIAVGASDNAALDTFMTAISSAIATAVVTHIITSAVVVGAGVAPPGGGPVPVSGTVT